LACQAPASSTFLSEQTSHQQPANSIFLSQQISTSHQPSAKRKGWLSISIGDLLYCCIIEHSDCDGVLLRIGTNSNAKGLTHAPNLRLCLVGLWFLKKLLWAVGCGKVAVRKQLWEKQKTVWLEVLSNCKLSEKYL
jgi:hypothetical protein